MESRPQVVERARGSDPDVLIEAAEVRAGSHEHTGEESIIESQMKRGRERT